MAAANAIVAFTGAGVAAESGIPTFRGQGGLWERYPPTIYGTPFGLAGAAVFRPSKIISFVRDCAGAFFGAEANEGHRALGDLEEQGRLLAVITQNIDDLHELGGAKTVIKLHGDLLTARCRRCSCRTTMKREDLRRRVAEGTKGRLWWGLGKLLSIYPRCEECKGRQRPDVVLFGEALPDDAVVAAENALERCDLLIIAGTSGRVYPANQLPEIARRLKIPVIEISPDRTPFSGWVDHHIAAPFAPTMSKLVAKGER